MGPKIVDKGQRKRALALQALEIFAKSGFEAASMSQIADAVGVGKGTLYDYFSSKDDLIYESLLAWTEQFTIGLEQLIEGIEGPEAQLRALGRVSMEMVEADPQFIQLSIAAMQVLFKEENASRYHFVSDAFGRLRKDIIQLFLTGVSLGVFRPELAQHAEKTAINMLAYLDGIGMHYYLSGREFDVFAQMDFYFDQLFARWRMEQEGASK